MRRFKKIFFGALISFISLIAIFFVDHEIDKNRPHIVRIGGAEITIPAAWVFLSSTNAATHFSTLLIMVPAEAIDIHLTPVNGREGTSITVILTDHSEWPTRAAEYDKQIGGQTPRIEGDYAVNKMRILVNELWVSRQPRKPDFFVCTRGVGGTIPTMCHVSDTISLVPDKDGSAANPLFFQYYFHLDDLPNVPKLDANLRLLLLSLAKRAKP